MDGTATLDKNFYNELINRFFNSKSYFYFCLTQQLNKSKTQNVLSKDNKIYLIERLINKLIHSRNAINELEKLSSLSGFDNFYQQIKKYIIRFDFKNADQDKIKDIISSVSNFFINRLVSILESYNVRNNLIFYLSGQPGNQQHKIVDIGEPTVRSYQDELLPEVDYSDNNANVLFEFFKEEILKSLKPLQRYSKPNSSTLIDNKFRSDWQRCSLRMKFIAMVHGYEQIEAIVTRIIRVLDFQKKSSNTNSKQITMLLLSARDFIENYLFQDQSQQSFLALLNNLDQYLTDIQQNEEQQNIIEDFSEVQIDQSPESNISQLKDNYVDKLNNEKNFKLPGEDDPELLSLIKEISDSKITAPTKKNDSRNEYTIIQHVTRKILNPNIIQKTANDFGTAQEEDTDKSDLRFFSEEIVLYVRLIKGALKSLLKNSNDDSALEDLELAASSLKSYAMKFGFEKLSRLPDVIEDIAQISKNQKIELPMKTLQTMADAIILLQNISHDITFRERFRFIFKELNHYLFRIKSHKKQNELIQL